MTSLLACRLSCQGTTTVQSVAKGMITKKITSVRAVKCTSKVSISGFECENCNQFFLGQQCFDLHIRVTSKGNSTCKSIYRCTDCGKTVNKKMDKNHACGQIYCHICEDFYQQGHQCYMQPEEPSFQQPLSVEEELVDEIENAKMFIFFYFECTQDNLVQCEIGYTPDVFGKCTHCLKS